MVKVDITEEMVSRSQERADAMGAIKNSITKGKGNLAGFLGEEMVLKLFSSCRPKSTKDYDIIYTDMMGDELKVEVKTKRRTVPPQPDYTCHVNKTSSHQNPDVYVFCQVNIKTEPYEGWVLGWLPKDIFYSRAEFRAKGQLDERGFKEYADSFVIRIKDLYQVDLF